jgi:two-component system response regulator FixJ
LKLNKVPRSGWVYIVDDDEAIRKSGSFMLRAAGFTVQCFATGVDFIDQVNRLEPGCVILDISMPEMTGLEVQAALSERGANLPIIVMTGHGDLAVAIKAMKAGACNFFEKPFERAALVEAIEEAFERLEDAAHALRSRQKAQARLRTLSKPEFEVLRCLIRDCPGATIALELGLSVRAVEVYRASLMEKLEVASLAETLRFAFVAGVALD